MHDAPEPGGPRPPELRFLKALVTALTTVMVLGLVAIVALLVIRLQPPSPPPPLPDTVTLPDGTRASAFTQGRDWFAVITEADEILIFDRPAGTLRQRIEILPAGNTAPDAASGR